MAFWKKSEDPWDMEPEKRCPVPAEEEKGPGLLDQLQDWNEARKAEKAKREALLPPMTCPWCGKEMEPVYLNGGRDGVYWHKERPDAIFGNLEAERLDTDGTFWNRYKLAWHCPACRKLVADLPEPAPSLTEEEFRKYAEQAKQREGEH